MRKLLLTLALGLTLFSCAKKKECESVKSKIAEYEMQYTMGNENTYGSYQEYQDLCELRNNVCKGEY